MRVEELARNGNKVGTQVGAPRDPSGARIRGRPVRAMFVELWAEADEVKTGAPSERLKLRSLETLARQSCMITPTRHAAAGAASGPVSLKSCLSKGSGLRPILDLVTCGIANRTELG